MLVEGGISFSINLADKYKKKMQKGESLSVPKDEDLIEEIKVKGIYLPSIGGTAGLWTSSMTAFGSDATTYQQKARETLRPHGHVNTIPGTNAANEPQSITVFSAASTTLLFTSEFVAYIKRLAAGVSVLEDVPIVTDYVNSRAASPAGTVGLRVNTYGKHPGPHKDRQSHHTTQLLLMEYFRNDSNPKPFNKSKAYPGLKWSSGKPEKHKSILGEINFLNLAKGTRGDAMPAILLATRTHQKGGLHIKPTTSTDDDRTNRRATQGRTLHDKYDAKFKDSMTSTGLKTDYFSHEKKSDAEFTAYLNGLTVTEQDKVGDATHNAMQATYQWVHGKMLPALERALEQHEVPYYREIALKKKERRKGDSSTDLIDAYDMKGANVHPVYRHAVENNDTVMQGEGWLA